MRKRVQATEAQIREFLKFYASKGYWPRADRRTTEGRAQEGALHRGWIEPVPSGTCYHIRFTVTRRGRSGGLGPTGETAYPDDPA